jgi:hypothetical protein
MKTKVVFRKFKGDIIALFPEQTERGYKVWAYVHGDQNIELDYNDIIKGSKLATETEYTDLKNELESLGYDLDICKKYKVIYFK